EGNYSAWLEQKQARLAQEEKEASALRRTIERELEWVHMSPRARQAKGKARLTRYEQLVAQAEQIDRGPSDLTLSIPFTQRLGEMVIDAEGLHKGYGDRTLIEDLSFDLPLAGLVGIIGPNGAGKTSLFRMLTGAEEAD